MSCASPAMIVTRSGCLRLYGDGFWSGIASRSFKRSGNAPPFGQRLQRKVPQPGTHSLQALATNRTPLPKSFGRSRQEAPSCARARDPENTIQNRSTIGGSPSAPEAGLEYKQLEKHSFRIRQSASKQLDLFAGDSFESSRDPSRSLFRRNRKHFFLEYRILDSNMKFEIRGRRE